MAGRCVGNAAPLQKFSCPTDGSTAVTRGALLYCDPTVAAGGVVRLCTATAGAITAPALFVATQTIASTGTTVEAYLVTPDQVWEWDTLADTAANQLFKRDLVSTSLLINNTSTDVATTFGILTHLVNAGATTARKALYKFNVCGNVTA